VRPMFHPGVWFLVLLVMEDELVEGFKLLVLLVRAILVLMGLLAVAFVGWVGGEKRVGKLLRVGFGFVELLSFIVEDMMDGCEFSE